VIGASFTSADLAMLVVVFLLLVTLAFLAVAEMGLSKMTRPKAASLADQGHRAGPALVKLIEHPERWVNPLLLTVNICQIVQATLTGVVAGRLFGALGVTVGVALNVVVFYVVTEALPKTYAALYPERAALLTARPVSALVASPPLQIISRALIWLTNVIVPGKGLEKGPFVSESELLAIVETAAQEGVVEAEEHELIESIIEFGDTVAREVMVPRPDMAIIPHDASVTQALDLAIARGYSRLPVHGADGDDIVGLAYVKDMIRSEREGRGATSVLDLARPVRFVPENKPLNQLMREMQAGKFHLAIVADEYGDVAGLITLEDCLEELVGEIVDEYDTESLEVERLPNGDYLVNGGMAVSELNDLLDLDIPDEDWDTVAGFVFNSLGHVPIPGEMVTHEGWQFIAEEVQGRRIRRLRVSVAPVEGDELHGALSDPVAGRADVEYGRDGEGRAVGR
jgi:CBS domain containing-hemolysin-like protein